MWRLHRYYLRELAINAGIAFLVLFAIVVVSLVARGIQRAQGGGLLDAAVITLFWALDALPHLLPIAFLLATVLTFARANQDRELVAIRSAGISPRTAMTAAWLLALLLSIVGSLAMHYVLPEIHFRKYRVIAEVVRNVIINMKLGTGNDRITVLDVVLTFGRREGELRNGEDIVLSDCWLYLPNSRWLAAETVSPIVHVDRVTIPLPNVNSTSLDVFLQNVRDPLNDTRLNMPVTFPLRSISEQNRRDERDDDICSDQLLAEVLRGVHSQPTAAVYTLNRRTCFAALPLLLAPLGFCIALAARDRGRALALVLALVPLVVFYAGDVLGAKLLRATDHPAFGWTPAALLLVLGAPFCWRELRR